MPLSQGITGLASVSDLFEMDVCLAGGVNAAVQASATTDGALVLTWLAESRSLSSIG